MRSGPDDRDPRAARRGPALRRRELVVGGALAGAGALIAGCGDRRPHTATAPAPRDERSPAVDGRHQAGVDRPWAPPVHLVLVALQADRIDRAATRAGDELAALGRRILALTAARNADPDAVDGPGRLTVQVGIGPRMVRRVGTGLPGSDELPRFAGSADLRPGARGADLVLAVADDDPAVPFEVVDRLLADLGGYAVGWRQAGYRPPSATPIARNPLGYHDGVVQPESRERRQRDVWIASGPAAGATIGVVRRFALDLDGFQRLPPDERDRVIGRRQGSGAPLSGGGLRTPPDLAAKRSDGEYLIPPDSHVRAAHPSFTGSDEIMLRRGYGFRAMSEQERPAAGLLFVSYQRRLEAFVRTQRRMDDRDRLMAFATPTAEATFLVLPGFDEARPLGGTLLATGGA